MKTIVENVKSKLNNFSLSYEEQDVWSGNAKTHFTDELASLKDARSYMSNKSIIAIGYCIDNLEKAKMAFDEYNKVYQSYDEYKQEYDDAYYKYRQVCNDPDCGSATKAIYKNSMDSAKAKMNRVNELLPSIKSRLRQHLNNIK